MHSILRLSLRQFQYARAALMQMRYLYYYSFRFVFYHSPRMTTRYFSWLLDRHISVLILQRQYHYSVPKFVFVEIPLVSFVVLDSIRFDNRSHFGHVQIVPIAVASVPVDMSVPYLVPIDRPDSVHFDGRSYHLHLRPNSPSSLTCYRCHHYYYYRYHPRYRYRYSQM